jgi:uncharacterized protein (DUF488 family)
MEIYTIGFTKKTATQFFGALREAYIEQLLDVRLNNVSQLAGFTKRDDLDFFLREICHAIYRHEPLLAPTHPLLDSYKKKHITWREYEDRFRSLWRIGGSKNNWIPTSLASEASCCVVNPRLSGAIGD